MHLETERLLIRPWRHEDADRLLDLLSRLEVVKWLGDGEPVLMKDLDEAHTRINRYAERDDPPLGMWAVERSDRRRTGSSSAPSCCSRCRTTSTARSRSAGTSTPMRGGTATPPRRRAAVLRHGFAGGLPEIIAVSHTDNDAVERGDAADRHDRPRHRREVVRRASALFAITAEQWAGPRQPNSA